MRPHISRPLARRAAPPNDKHQHRFLECRKRSRLGLMVLHDFLARVAERALFLWNNDNIRSLIIQNQDVILPIILPYIEKSIRGHWNHAVQSLTRNVRKVFMDADQSFFDQCLAKFNEYEAKEKEMLERRVSNWKRLEDIAAAKPLRNEPLPVSIFPSSVAIGS